MYSFFLHDMKVFNKDKGLPKTESSRIWMLVSAHDKQLYKERAKQSDLWKSLSSQDIDDYYGRVKQLFIDAVELT